MMNRIRKAATKMPVVSITGPRQSGKTTLARECFPKYDYVNLEDPEAREYAQQDPRAFLGQFKKGVIIDEAQYVPVLFSYIQVISDESKKPGKFILSGSQNFLLLEKISQSLAGRVAVFHLLPFSISELNESGLLVNDFEPHILKGFYPRVYDKKLNAYDFYASYLNTYIERDVRQITAVQNLSDFQKLLRLCAGSAGQLVNFSSLSIELGVNEKTVKSWLSVLETSFVIFFLQPYHTNFRKRLVKTPKLFFTDTGLAAYLLGIKNKEQLSSHFAKGALFENLIIANLLKEQYNKGERASLYFWRDNSGNEVDCLYEDGTRVKPIEVKSGKTIQSDFFRGIKNLNKVLKAKPSECFLVYGGNSMKDWKEARVVGWDKSGGIVSGF